MMKYSKSFDDLPVSRSIPSGASGPMSPEERNSRILSLLGYFGLAPFFWFFGSLYRNESFFRQHLLNSLALSFIALFGAALEIIPGVILYSIFGFDLNSKLRTSLMEPSTLQTLGMLIFLAELLFITLWSLAWSVCVLGAVRGRTPHLPVVSKAASMNWAVGLGVYSSLLEYLLVLALIGVGIDSMRIANARNESADVYVLYTVGGYIPVERLYETYTPPGWAVTMAFYPLVQAGIERYGENRVSVLPLTEANINQAIHSGRFIFIASHGGSTPGTFSSAALPYHEYGPANVPQGYVGDWLQFVYFAGCDAGYLESQWRSVLRVEDAIMFDRISYVDEHMLWVWFKSPGVIAALN